MSSMNHEIRNPLNATLGCFKLLEHSLAEFEEESRELVNRGTASGEILLAMVNNVIDVG